MRPVLLFKALGGKYMSEHDFQTANPTSALRLPSRSNALHTTYRALKAQVQAAETVADVNDIVWPAEGEDSK